MGPSGGETKAINGCQRGVGQASWPFAGKHAPSRLFFVLTQKNTGQQNGLVIRKQLYICQKKKKEESKGLCDSSYHDRITSSKQWVVGV